MPNNSKTSKINDNDDIIEIFLNKIRTISTAKENEYLTKAGNLKRFLNVNDDKNVVFLTKVKNIIQSTHNTNIIEKINKIDKIDIITILEYLPYLAPTSPGETLNNLASQLEKQSSDNTDTTHQKPINNLPNDAKINITNETSKVSTFTDQLNQILTGDKLNMKKQQLTILADTLSEWIEPFKKTFKNTTLLKNLETQLSTCQTTIIQQHNNLQNNNNTFDASTIIKNVNELNELIKQAENSSNHSKPANISPR